MKFSTTPLDGDVIAADCAGLRVKYANVGIDEIPFRVEINSSDMQGLVDVSDVMGQYQERLAFILEAERRRRWFLQ